MTAGPDGALWFTEWTGNKLGRITTAGLITEYNLPTPLSFPWSITVGPDGALWFTEYRNDKIGRSPVCGLGLGASVSNGILKLNFALGITKPAVWTTMIQQQGSGSAQQLWSLPISATFPPIPQIVAVPFLGIGPATITSDLADETTGTQLCTEVRNVDAF